MSGGRTGIGGPLGTIILDACWGAIFGVVIGGVSGGLGALGATAGKPVSCASTFWKIEEVRCERTASTKVYNFQVEGYHTYCVGEEGIWVHNAQCILNKDGSYDVKLKNKEDWTPEQKAQAKAKVEALSKADTKKIPVNRSGTSASKMYKNANPNKTIPKGCDIDHTIELQVGGENSINNLKPLDRSVNRSIGAQIRDAIKDLPDNAILRNFFIE